MRWLGFMAEIKVVILRVDSKEMEINDSFDHTLKNMQSVVGGYLEAIRLGSVVEGREITIWLNEEGKLEQLEPNFAIVRKKGLELLDVVVGDVLITSCDDEGNTVGLNDEELELVKSKFDFDYGLVSPIFVDKTLFV
jgi:hypothetical protein